MANFNLGQVVVNFGTTAKVVGFFSAASGVSDMDGWPILKAIGANGKPRGGKWVAQVIKKGDTEELHIMDDVSVYNNDDRNELPPLTFILRELLDGADAVNPETMAKRIKAEMPGRFPKMWLARLDACEMVPFENHYVPRDGGVEVRLT